MKIGQACTRNVTHIGRHEPISEAARRMRDEHVGDLVVVEERAGGHVPVGLLTDRDIVVELVATDVDRIRQLEVGDLVTRELVTARDDEDVEQVLARMQQYGVRRMPVVDASGHLIGVFAIDDLLGLLSGDLAAVVSLIGRERRNEVAHRK